MNRLEDVQETIGNNKSIVLRNINLEGVTLQDQYNKLSEEFIEYRHAIDEYELNPTKENRLEVIKELLDVHQVDFGIVNIKFGITANEIMDVYNEYHLPKMDHRPRVK